MSDVKKVAQEYGEKMKVLQGQFVGTADRLAMAFLSGAAWQREQDAKVAEDCDGLRHSGTSAYRHIGNRIADAIRSKTSDEVDVGAVDHRHGVKPTELSQNDNACEDWCHCRKCGGFKPGGKPYGHSCSCSQQECKVKESGK